MRQLMQQLQFAEIEALLRSDPSLANKGVYYCSDQKSLAHPLHRICDGVFEGSYGDEEGLKLAKLFLRFGANVDGNELVEKNDTPLIAACSLHADLLALLYLVEGANIHHQGCMGGTALHWACWTGRADVVSALLAHNVELNKLCIDHRATPLFWAVHGFKRGSGNNLHQQINCVELLVHAGAQIDIPNGEGTLATELLDSEDGEMRAALGAIPL